MNGRVLVLTMLPLCCSLAAAQGIEPQSGPSAAPAASPAALREYGRARLSECVCAGQSRRDLRPYERIQATQECLLSVPSQTRPVAPVLALTGDARTVGTIDLARVPLGSERRELIHRLPTALCTVKTESSIDCRWRPQEWEFCRESSVSREAVKVQISDRFSSAYSSPLSSPSEAELNALRDAVGRLPAAEGEYWACIARYPASKEVASDVIWDGQSLAAVRLTFDRDRLVEVRFRTRDVDATSRWMTMRYGAPTVSVSTVGSTFVRVVPLSLWDDRVVVDDNRRDVRHQTWSGPGIEVQSEDAEFRITAVGQR